MAITLNGTTGITTPALDSDGNLEYSGTLTGGTGVVNLGSGQVYKNASGNVGIGTSNPFSLFHASGTATISTNANTPGTTGWQGVSIVGSIGTINISRNGSNVLAFYHTSNANGIAGSPVGTVSVTTTATTYATSSDYRLKENVQPMIGALEKVAQLKPVTYTWKVDGSNGQGFIAHELQAVVPDCVTGEKDAVDKDGKPQYQGVDTSFLVATLVAAIQEQQTIIQSLTARIEALEKEDFQ